MRYQEHPVKSLADVRLRMSPGTRVHVENYLHPGASGNRTVVKNQPNAIRFATDEGKDIWLDWPRSDGWRLDGADSVVFLAAQRAPRVNYSTPGKLSYGDPLLTLTFLS